MRANVCIEHKLSASYKYIPLIRGKNPSVSRTLTANRNPNPNPTTLLTLWIFSSD